MRRVVIEFEGTDKEAEAMVAASLMELGMHQVGGQKGTVIRMENQEVEGREEGEIKVAQTQLKIPPVFRAGGAM